MCGDIETETEIFLFRDSETQDSSPDVENDSRALRSTATNIQSDHSDKDSQHDGSNKEAPFSDAARTHSIPVKQDVRHATKVIQNVNVCPEGEQSSPHPDGGVTVSIVNPEEQQPPNNHLDAYPHRLESPLVSKLSEGASEKPVSKPVDEIGDHSLDHCETPHSATTVDTGDSKSTPCLVIEDIERKVAIETTDSASNEESSSTSIPTLQPGYGFDNDLEVPVEGLEEARKREKTGEKIRSGQSGGNQLAETGPADLREGIFTKQEQNSLPSSVDSNVVNGQSTCMATGSTVSIRQEVSGTLDARSPIGPPASSGHVGESEGDGQTNPTQQRPEIPDSEGGNEDTAAETDRLLGGTDVHWGDVLRRWCSSLEEAVQRVRDNSQVDALPATLFALTVSSIIATVIVSSRLMEKSCFNDLTASDVEYLECACYLVTTLALFLYFYLMSRSSSLSGLELRETVKGHGTRFDVGVTVSGMIMFSIFPLVLNSWKLVFMQSCWEEIVSGLNSTATRNEYSAEQMTSATAGICVIAISVFVIIHKLLHFSVGHFYFRALLLGVVSLTVLILWISSLATEVAEHSPLQLYRQCKGAEVLRDCRQKENDLAKISSLFTPLVIEFCIMCFSVLAELWKEIASKNTSGATDETPNDGANSAETDNGIVPRSDDPSASQGTVATESRSSEAGNSSEVDQATDTVLRERKRAMFFFLALFGVAALVNTIAYVTALNDINEAAILIPEEPTSESSAFSELESQLYGRKSSKLYASSKPRCGSDVLTPSSPDLNQAAVNSTTPLPLWSPQRKELHKTIETYFTVRTVSNAVCFVVFLIICYELIQVAVKEVKNRHSTGVSDFIILTTCSAVTGFSSLCVAADIYCLTDNSLCGCLSHDYYIRELCDYLVNIFQFVLQAHVLLSLEHRQVDGYASGKRGVGRSWRCLSGILLYLFVVNAVCWGTDSFYEVKTELDAGLFLTQNSIYGKRTWHVITQAFYPLAVYFRFHSALIFLKAFYHTWLKGDFSTHPGARRA